MRLYILFAVMLSIIATFAFHGSGVSWMWSFFSGISITAVSFIFSYFFSSFLTGE